MQSRISRLLLVGAAAGVSALVMSSCAGGSSGDSPVEPSRSVRIAYEEPVGGAQSMGADILEREIIDLLGFDVQAFPAGQLGNEPELLEKTRSGEVDVIMTTTANASSVAPASGVLSLHYLFEDREHNIAAIADEGVFEAYAAMAEAQVTGMRPLGLFLLPIRNIYGSKPVESVDDLKGLQIRVQATATEDTIFSAYGAQPVHMAFPEVYTSLQTGVIEAAENAITTYNIRKHNEVAPVLSLTEHEGNSQVIWVSDRFWNSLDETQQELLMTAARTVSIEQPPLAYEQADEILEELRESGTTVVEDVDKESLASISRPLQDEIAAELGEHAVDILEAVRRVTTN